MSDARPTDASLRNFGFELRRLRQAAGKSLRELSEEVDVTASYLSILEKADNPKTKRPSQPSMPLVLRLARALNASFDEAIGLARDTGYDLSNARDHMAVAEVLAGGRLPAVFQQLLDLEIDLASYAGEVRMVEAPVFTVLGHLDRAADGPPSVFITGRAFRAWGRPAQLYGLKKHLETDGLLHEQVEALKRSCRPTGPLKIAVLGEYMTPTVLLLKHLERAGATYKLENSDRLEAGFSGPVDREANDEPIVIEVLYSDEGQAELLKFGAVQLALMVHPFRRVRDNGHQFMPIDLDLWVLYRDAKLPMSLVVTTPETLVAERQRSELIERMDKLRLTYGMMIVDTCTQALDALVDTSDSPDRAEHEPTVLETFDEVYLEPRDKGVLANQLSKLSALGHHLGLLKHERAPKFYEPFILTKDDLISP